MPCRYQEIVRRSYPVDCLMLRAAIREISILIFLTGSTLALDGSLDFAKLLITISSTTVLMHGRRQPRLFFITISELIEFSCRILASKAVSSGTTVILLARRGPVRGARWL